MILPKNTTLTQEERKQIEEILADFNCTLSEVKGKVRSIYLIIGDETSELLVNRLRGLDFVERVNRVQTPYKCMALGSSMQGEVSVGGKTIGNDFFVIAGQCTIDPKNPQLYLETAHAVKEAGADVIRGGVWKPRTSPHSFQGDNNSLNILLRAREETGLPINTEVMDESQLDILIDAKVDMLQIGARNALNYSLLKKIGEKTKNTNIAVLLKRPIHMGSVTEFINAAEYIASGGNTNICMCPRGTLPKIEEFRNNPDESITIILKEKTWAPVIVDPSHSMGRPHYVPYACLSAASYGADGICVETHIHPKKGIGDDPRQAITPQVLKQVIDDCKNIYQFSKKYQ